MRQRAVLVLAEGERVRSHGVPNGRGVHPYDPRLCLAQ